MPPTATRFAPVKPKIFTLDRAAFNQGINAKYPFRVSEDDIADTLVARGPSAVAIIEDKNV